MATSPQPAAKLSTEQLVSQLWDSRGRALVSYGYLLCGDITQAEDLAQDAIVKVLISQTAEQNLNVLDAYTKKTLLHLWLDSTRRTQRWHRVKHLFTPRTETGELPDSSPVTDPAEQLTRADSVRQALDQLPSRVRACIVLRYWEDQTGPPNCRATRIKRGHGEMISRRWRGAASRFFARRRPRQFRPIP